MPTWVIVVTCVYIISSFIQGFILFREKVKMTKFIEHVEKYFREKSQANQEMTGDEYWIWNESRLILNKGKVKQKWLN